MSQLSLLIEAFLFCTFLTFYCLVSLQPVAPLPEKFSARFPIVILPFPSRQYVVSMFPASFYFEICVFKKMNQLPSPLWPILQLHSIALSIQLRIASARASTGVLKGSVCCGPIWQTLFPQGAVQWLRKSEEKSLWRVTQAWGCSELRQRQKEGFE